MKSVMALFVLSAVGCAGAAGSDKGLPEGRDEVPERQKAKTEIVESEESSSSVIIEGTFENSSCGDRKYNRRISFQKEGVFNARDEVAPCPPDAKCVWSGIIEWSGKWVRQNGTLSIEADLPVDGKMPEKIPSSFIVLTESPLTLGEKNGNLVCPYKRVK